MGGFLWKTLKIWGFYEIALILLLYLRWYNKTIWGGYYLWSLTKCHCLLLLEEQSHYGGAVLVSLSLSASVSLSLSGSAMVKVIATAMAWVLAFLLAAGVGLSEGAVYKVGDAAGWTIMGSPNYTAWALSKKFEVGDTIGESSSFFLLPAKWIAW